MLLTRATLEAIAADTVTLAFRRWRRPTVRTGGTLTTAVGMLSIDDVSPVDLGDITESDARASGHADLKTLRGLLSKGAGRTVYRIALRRRGPDPRIALRAAVPSAADMDRIEARMARWDSASPSGPWTRKVLRLLGRRPGVRAPDLAQRIGMETLRFKTNVRKLKGLGLTESLTLGDRLSPRGETSRARTSRKQDRSHEGLPT